MLTTIDPKRMVLRSNWSAATRARHAQRIEVVFPPTPPPIDLLPFCPACARDFTGFVYACWWQGIERYPAMCSECAADWVAMGGSIVVRVVTSVA